METSTLLRRGAPLFVSALCVTATALANEAASEAPSAFPVLEQPATQPVAPAEYGWSYQPGTGLTYSSADGGNKISFGGRIMNDWAFMSADDGTKGVDPTNPFVDGTEFRRARLEASGTLYDKVSFKASYDFASNPTTGFRDVWMGISDVVGTTDFRVGKQKEPFSLEEITSSKYITFMERSLANSMAPAYNTGAVLHDHYDESHVSYGIGVFRDTGEDGSSAQQKDGAYNFTGRVTWAPVYDAEDARLVHVGIAGSLRRPEMSSGVSTRPEAHLAPPVLDSGSINTDQVTQYGGEFAWVGGPWSVQAEYIMQTISGLAGAPDVDTTGYYAFVSYFLTGESRPYHASDGSFGRVKPAKNYGQDGSGAWELAARYSSLDIDAPAVATAGDVNDITIGANWYLNPNARIMFNYVLGDLDSNTDAFDGNMNIFMMRFQVDF
ncbi:MAG: porin [Planctomycetes bacterium]|nr:porin [Planctomycetota bacterium]MCB9904443.1 porin [Planctomycetota bacterium]